MYDSLSLFYTWRYGQPDISGKHLLFTCLSIIITVDLRSLAFGFKDVVCNLKKGGLYTNIICCFSFFFHLLWVNEFLLDISVLYKKKRHGFSSSLYPHLENLRVIFPPSLGFRF